MRIYLVLLALILQGLFTNHSFSASVLPPIRMELKITPPLPTIGTLFVREAVGGFSYAVEASRDMVNWENINTEVASPSGEFSIVVPAVTDDPVRFFRVRQLSETLAISSDAATPSYQIAAGGSVGVITSIFKLRMPVSDGLLFALPIKLTSGSPQSLFQVTFWDGSSEIGRAVFTGNSKKALVVFSSSAAPFLKGGTDNSLTVKVDLTGIGPQSSGTSGDLVTIDYDDDPAPGMEARAVSLRTGERIPISGNTHSGGVRIFKSYPAVAFIPLPSSGVSDGRLLRFSASASQLGAIALGKMQVNVNASNASVSDVNVFAYSDPSFSQPISGLGSGGKLLQIDASSGQSVVGLGMLVIPQTVSGNETSVQVSAGNRVYFEVRAVVKPASPDFYVVTELMGDSDASQLTPLITETEGRYSVATGNFVWSPNSRTISDIADPDWTNGYAVPGLPPNGITQVRTN